MRTRMLVNKFALQDAIKLVESENTFANWGELCEAVSNTSWAKNHKPRPVSSQAIGKKIKEYGLQIKTPKGKRGGNRKPLSEEQKAKMVAARRNKRVVDVSDITVPDLYSGLLNKVANGSLISAIKLKCIQCTDYNTKEIKYCTVSGCALHSLRPYQEKSIDKTTQLC